MLPSHVVFCSVFLAFSIFSACEYGIAFTNIGFHYTATYELENMVWVFGMPTQQSQTGNNHKKKD